MTQLGALENSFLSDELTNRFDHTERELAASCDRLLSLVQQCADLAARWMERQADDPTASDRRTLG